MSSIQPPLYNPINDLPAKVSSVSRNRAYMRAIKSAVNRYRLFLPQIQAIDPGFKTKASQRLLHSFRYFLRLFNEILPGIASNLPEDQDEITVTEEAVQFLESQLEILPHQEENPTEISTASIATMMIWLIADHLSQKACQNTSSVDLMRMLSLDYITSLLNLLRDNRNPIEGNARHKR